MRPVVGESSQRNGLEYRNTIWWTCHTATTMYIRSVTPETRNRVLASVRRIIDAECTIGISLCPATIEPFSSYPQTINDIGTMVILDEVFDTYFRAKRHMPNIKSVLGSEDFEILGAVVNRPYCFWFFSGYDIEKCPKGTPEEEIPGLYSPDFTLAV
jgi:metal-dependent amidase/aminoacylase/carboxypeptidase family protein